MKILQLILLGIAIFLTIRAVQIHREVAKAAAARRALLDHFVDHTIALTKQQVEEHQFWSKYGDHSERAFHWMFLGGIATFAIASLLEKREARASRLQETRE